MTLNERPGNMVSTAWLAGHLHDPALRIVDIRGRVLPATEPPPHYFSHRDDYEKSHIPGAVFIDWTTDIVDPGSPTYDIASPARYADLMSHLGIGDETMVVAYDDANGMFAARLWWSLNFYGHDQVAVLDGGWQKWLAEKHPVTDAIPQPEPATFTIRENSTLRATADSILKRSESTLIWDTRSEKEYRGEASRANRMGRIPGALNLPRKQLLNDDGRLPDAATLRQKLRAAGLDPDAPEIIIYCNSGVSASFGLLALRQAGSQAGVVYDGSWKDWANDEVKPVE